MRDVAKFYGLKFYAKGENIYLYSKYTKAVFHVKKRSGSFNEHGKAFKIKNTDYFANHYKIEDLARFIEKFFNKNINLAINSLEQL